MTSDGAAIGLWTNYCMYACILPNRASRAGDGEKRGDHVVRGHVGWKKMRGTNVDTVIQQPRHRCRHCLPGTEEEEEEEESNGPDDLYHSDR